jgi:hypothetical protein
MQVDQWVTKQKFNGDFEKLFWNFRVMPRLKQITGDPPYGEDRQTNL